MASAAPSAGVPGRTPLEEKNACRKALERGKVDLAIEAGARSVAGDPTDAEAWLLLGSAYQDKGKWTDAVRVYRMCVRAAKRGPVHECAAMLK